MDVLKREGPVVLEEEGVDGVGQSVLRDNYGEEKTKDLDSRTENVRNGCEVW